MTRLAVSQTLISTLSSFCHSSELGIKAPALPFTHTARVGSVRHKRAMIRALSKQLAPWGPAVAALEQRLVGCSALLAPQIGSTSQQWQAPAAALQQTAWMSTDAFKVSRARGNGGRPMVEVAPVPVSRARLGHPKSACAQPSSSPHPQLPKLTTHALFPAEARAQCGAALAAVPAPAGKGDGGGGAARLHVQGPAHPGRLLFSREQAHARGAAAVHGRDRAGGGTRLPAGCVPLLHSRCRPAAAASLAGPRLPAPKQPAACLYVSTAGLGMGTGQPVLLPRSGIAVW